MKINIGRRRIEKAEEVKLNDIPLCYIDTTKKTVTPNFTIPSQFLREKKVKLNPVWTHHERDPFIFNGENKIILDPPIQHAANGSQFAPHHSKSFVPTSFSFDVTIQRQNHFSELDYHDIIASAVDSTSDHSFSKKIVSILANAGLKGKCPQNVVFNNNATEFTSLYKDFNKPSFIFCSSPDGVKIPNSQTISQRYNVDDETINYWVFVDKNAPYVVENKDQVNTTKVGFLNSFYKKEDRKTPPYIIDQAIASGTEGCPITMDDNTTKLYDDIYVVQKHKQKFVIIAPITLLDDENAEENQKIILDVLQYIYFRSFKRTISYVLRITDLPIDYKAFSIKQWNRFHEPVNVKDLVDKVDGEYNVDYKVVAIHVSRKDVTLVKIDETGNLYFRKNKDAKLDPDKKPEMISFTDALNTRVWLYEPRDIYEIETPLNLSYKQLNNDSLAIDVAPMFSSEYKINSTKAQTLTIEDFTKKYALCAKPDFPQIETKFKIVEFAKYEAKQDGIILAQITFNIKKEDEIYDIRILGGGLPHNEEPNYNLIDIGNIYGRPYRLGSTLIIKMPKRFQPYEDKIKVEVEKHIASGEHFVLVFNDEDNK